MTTIHHTPPPGAPFAIYEDPEDQQPPSPSEVYDGEISFSSDVSLDADEALPSVEHEHEHDEEEDDENEDREDMELPPYRSSYTSRPSMLSSSQSRRISGVTNASFISDLPSEMSIASKPIAPANHALDTRYTPRKERPTFRNPSSVRAMQMSSPPPLIAFESPRDRLRAQYKLATPSRSGRSETPVSVTRSKRSGSHRESPRPTPTPQQHLPLVLLHVTILPMQFPYSPDIMEKVMPHWLVENYKLLEEKLKDIVLMQRGLLISHPRDEFDVLEERILEGLELQTPRLLKCGHFMGPDHDDDDHAECDDDTASITDDTGRGSRMSGGTLTVDEDADKYPSLGMDDASVCMDCHRQVKKPGSGIGAGTKKWSIKIFAANGLMREGAWCAAWSEMERCDVEIAPWIPEEVRKTVEKRALEELEADKRRKMYAAEVQRRIDEETARLKAADEAEEKRRIEEAALQQQIKNEESQRQRRLEEEAMRQQSIENALEEKIEEVKETIRLDFEAQALAETNAVAERFRALEEELKREQSKRPTRTPQVSGPPPYEFPSHEYVRDRQSSSSHRPPMGEVPLGVVLKNYFTLLLQDQKNIAIVALSMFVLILAMNMNPMASTQLAPPSISNVLEDLPPVVITTTATTTAVSIATTTVTKVDYITQSATSERVLSSSTAVHDSIVSPEAMVHNSKSAESPEHSSTPEASAPTAHSVHVEGLQSPNESVASSSNTRTVSTADDSATAKDPPSFTKASASSYPAAEGSQSFPEPLNQTPPKVPSLPLPFSDHGAGISVSETPDAQSDERAH